MNALKTTKRKAEIIRRIEIILEHREIGHGFAVYRVTQDIDGETSIKEGLATKVDLDLLIAGDLELRDLTKNPVLKRGEWHSGIVAVYPEFLAALRHQGWNGDPENPEADHYKTGIYDQAKRSQIPLTDMEKGKALHFIELFDSGHQAFTLHGEPMPVCLGFSYINGCFDNRDWKLKKLVKILSDRPDVYLAPHGGERAYSWHETEGLGKFIGDIPGYNSEPGRDKCVMFFWRPEVEDYRRVFEHATEARRALYPDKLVWHPSTGDLRNSVVKLDTLGIAKAKKQK